MVGVASFFGHVFRTKPLKVIQAEEENEQLVRQLGLFDLICLGVGGTVGSGVFSTTGNIISGTAGPAAFISWIIAGIVCCINAFSYMELSARVPSSGSTYAYTYHGIGELPAVIAAWLLTLEYGLSGSGVARSWADKVLDWDKTMKGDDSDAYYWYDKPYYNFLGFLITAASVAVLLMGVRLGKYAINTISCIKVGVVLFIIIAGFVAMDPDNLSPYIPERGVSPEGDEAYGAQGIITGASSAFFGYIGFDEVCCMAAEVKDSKKVMPRAVIGVVMITMVLSCLSSFVLSGMAPYKEANSFGSGFDLQNMHWAGEIVRAGETITMPVVVLVSLFAQPRLNYALACDGLMPQIFAKVNSKGDLFWNTLLTGCLFTIIAFFVPFSVLWDIVSFGILLSFILANISLLNIRFRDASPQLAPKLIWSMVIFSGLAAYCYQQGYVDYDNTTALVFAIIFLVLTVIVTFVLFFKCKQLAVDPATFTAPLVPFLQMIAILMDWYLSAQIPHLAMECSVAWIGAACISYFVYGFGHSAGRSNWNALLNRVNGGDRLQSPMLSSKA